MKEWDTGKITALLKKCGRITMNYYGNPRSEIKEDNTLVTVADKEVEELLSGYFDRPAENIYMIGEESAESKQDEYLVSALRNTCWIVDPIDGTAPYANRLPNWGISIAMAKEGKIREGAIFMPAFGQMLISDGRDVLYGEETSEPDSWDFTSLRKMKFRDAPEGEKGMLSISQKLAKSGCMNVKNPVMAVASCVYSMAGLLTGQYSAYVTNIKLWDSAAGLPMIFNAGFRVGLSTGEFLGLDINNRFYDLESSSPSKWFLRGLAVMAKDESTISSLLRNCKAEP